MEKESDSEEVGSGDI